MDIPICDWLRVRPDHTPHQDRRLSGAVAGQGAPRGRRLHAKVHLHGDPAIERRKNRIEAGNTFGKLVNQYLEFKQAELRPRSFAEVKRHLEINAKPLHSLPLASVDQAAIATRLNAVAKGGANRS